MKNLIVLLLAIIIFPFYGASQALEALDNIDYISPFNDGLAAIKKGNEWAFIDVNGNVAIDFRDDIMTTNIDYESYPVFKNGRCIITQEKDDIIYFGFIDALGNTIIKPQFLNATNFNNNRAIVLKLVKESLGKNTLLGKPVVSYKYAEAIINTEGNVTNYLSEPNPITLSKDFILEPPKIISKLISETVYATWTKDKKWAIKQIETIKN